MVKFCRLCKEKEIRGHNLYCDKCRELLKIKGAKRFRINSETYVWVRGNSIVRTVYRGEHIEAVYETLEVIE
jgi:RNase P subunit RPR2